MAGRPGLKELFEVADLLEQVTEDTAATMPGTEVEVPAGTEPTAAEPVEATELGFDTEWSQNSTESRAHFAQLLMPPVRARVEPTPAPDPTLPRLSPPRPVARGQGRTWWGLLLLLPVGVGLGYALARPPSPPALETSAESPRPPEFDVEPPAAELMAMQEPAPADAEMEVAPPVEDTTASPAKEHLPERERRRPRKARAERDKPTDTAVEVVSADIDASEAAARLRRLLRAQGLSRSDLNLIASEEHARWRAALDSGDAAREREAFERLADVLRRASIDRDLLSRKLSHVLESLREAGASGRIQGERARELEARYFELRRDLLAPGLEPDSAKARSLNQAIDALREDINRS